MNAPAVTKKKSQRSESSNSPECRVAYPYFHEKRTKNAAGLPLKSGPRNDGNFMFPKFGDASVCPNYKYLADMCFEAARKMWPGSVDQAGNWVWPQGALWPIKDGDIPLTSKPKPGQPAPTPEQIASKNAWRRGYWLFEAANFLETGPRVAIVQNGQIVEIPARIINGQVAYKSGDHGIANLHAYAYENEQFGVNFGFEGFCFTRPGEAIGSSGPRSAQSMFAGVAGMAPPASSTPPATGAPQPQPGYAPPPQVPAVPASTQYAPPAAPAPQQQYAPSLAPAAPPAPQQMQYAAPPPMPPQQYAPAAAGPAMAPPPPPVAPGAPPLPPMPQR